MFDMKNCNEKIAILRLRFPTTEKEEKSAFVKLIREHNPDLCETAECAAIHEPKIVEIMEAHQFWKENHEACNKIANDYANTNNAVYRKLNADFDFNTLDPSMQDAVSKHAPILEEILDFG